MSALSDDAAATSRLLYKVDVNLFISFSDVKATPSFCYYLTYNFQQYLVIVRPLSTVDYTSVTSVSTVDSGLTNLIHDRCKL